MAMFNIVVLYQNSSLRHAFPRKSRVFYVSICYTWHHFAHVRLRVPAPFLHVFSSTGDVTRGRMIPTMGFEEPLGWGGRLSCKWYDAENSETLSTSRSAMQDRNLNMGGCNCSKMHVHTLNALQKDSVTVRKTARCA